jgi:hypothetical protein
MGDRSRGNPYSLAFTLATIIAPLKRHAELLCVLAVAAILLSFYVKQNPNYSFTLLADAFLHGHVDVTAHWPGANVETVLVNEKRYVVQDPFPALLFLPFAALLGANAWSQEVASLCSGLVTIALYWLLFRRMGLDRARRLWLTAFVWLGTDLYWCTSAAGVWYVAVVISNLLTAWTFYELASRRRGWLIGLLAGAVLFTRPTMIVILVMYPYLMTLGAFGRQANLRRDLWGFLYAIAGSALGWIGFNEARFGTITNVAYSIYCAQVDVDVCRAGLFGFKYFVYQLYAFFLRPPTVQIFDQLSAWPYFGIGVEGIALTFTSPALIAACWAPRSRVVIALWIATIVTAIPSFLYYVNGFLQVGMRHALDFEPFIFVLMAYALRDNDRRWFRGLIAFSCIMGLWQSCFWWFYLGK